VFGQQGAASERSGRAGITEKAERLVARKDAAACGVRGDAQRGDAALNVAPRVRAFRGANREEDGMAKEGRNLCFSL